MRIPLPGANLEGVEQGQKLMDRFLNAPIERRYKEAHAQKEESEAKLPFGGHQLPGFAGQVMGLEMMKNLYGENSSQYKSAKNAFDLSQEHTGVLTNYQRQLTEILPKRTSTQLAKTDQEINDINNGFYPGTQTPINDPETQKKLLGQYQLKQQKTVTDADTRKKNLYAKNIDVTIDRINPQDLVQYSGPKGQLKLAGDKIQDARGKPSKEYIAYTNAQKNVDALAKQIRQFWGGSIQPSTERKLRELVDPATWAKSTQTALSNYNTIVKTLKQEMNTYRDALKSTDVYQGKENNAENNDPLGIL